MLWCRRVTVSSQNSLIHAERKPTDQETTRDVFVIASSAREAAAGLFMQEAQNVSVVISEF